MSHTKSLLQNTYIWSLISFFLILPVVVFGQGQTPPPGGSTPPQLENPIEADNLTTFLRDVLEAIVTLLIPIVVVFIVIAGFRFVMAQGNEEKLKKAKKNLLYVLIGTAIVIGANIILLIIDSTVTSLGVT